MKLKKLIDVVCGKEFSYSLPLLTRPTCSNGDRLCFDKVAAAAASISRLLIEQIGIALNVFDFRTIFTSAVTYG